MERQSHTVTGGREPKAVLSPTRKKPGIVETAWSLKD